MNINQLRTFLNVCLENGCSGAEKIKIMIGDHGEEFDSQLILGGFLNDDPDNDKEIILVTQTAYIKSVLASADEATKLMEIE